MGIPTPDLGKPAENREPNAKSARFLLRKSVSPHVSEVLANMATDSAGKNIIGSAHAGSLRDLPASTATILVSCPPDSTTGTTDGGQRAIPAAPLESEKVALEVEKLRREIRNLNWWILPPLSQAILTALITGGLAWWFGMMDARTDRLRSERNELTRQSEEAQARLESIQRKTDDFQKQEAEAASRRRAVAYIVTEYPHSTFRLGFEDGDFVGLRVNDPLDFDVFSFTPPPPPRAPNYPKLWESISLIPSLRELQFDNMPLNQDGFRAISRLSKLRSLRFAPSHEGELQTLAKAFSNRVPLQELEIEGGTLESGQWIELIPELRILKLRSCRVRPDFLTQVAVGGRNIRSLWLSHSSLPKGCGIAIQRQRLATLVIDSIRFDDVLMPTADEIVTELLPLAGTRIVIDPSQISSDDVSKIKSKCDEAGVLIEFQHKAISEVD